MTVLEGLRGLAAVGLDTVRKLFSRHEAIAGREEGSAMWVKQAENAESLDNVLACHSLNSKALQAHLVLYRTIMFGDSPLTRSEREALAVVVSAVNDCHY